MRNEDTLALVARYFRCVNEEDWAGMAELWHSDGQLDASGARLRTGPEEILDYLRKAFAPYVLHDDSPTVVSVDGGRAIVDVAFVGTTHDGRTVEIDARSEYDAVEGRFMRLTTRYDVEQARRDVDPAAASSER